MSDGVVPEPAPCPSAQRRRPRELLPLAALDDCLAPVQERRAGARPGAAGAQGPTLGAQRRRTPSEAVGRVEGRQEAGHFAVDLAVHALHKGFEDLAVIVRFGLKLH